MKPVRLALAAALVTGSATRGDATLALQNYGLGSPVSLLRIMIQQSNCFQVVERGAAMANLQEERALAANGDTLASGNVGKGQLQAADFVMTPGVQFAAADTGGIGGAITNYGGRLLGGLGSVVGGLAGNLKFKEAQTSLLIADVRSGIQVAAEEGVAKKTDFRISGWSWGGGDYTRLGGYTNTPEGKMVAASLLDNYNRIVQKIRNEPSLVRTSSAASKVNAQASTRAGTLKRSEEAIATGEERDGFVKIDGENVSGGWVQRTLVATQPAPQ